ncbi:MAG: methionine--tRNA ligase [Candidatus Methanomethylophilaceae archaeon]|nr:methionine--tRNA ligase [Candidatus Methanomethylophilaceae archaeon]
MSRIFIGVAWPYANGVIHLGHMAGSILPPDIFSRYNRLLGNEVLMVSGSDQHGTPITVTAEKEGASPEQVADRYHGINKKAIEDMGIEFSLFTKTHTENHIQTVQDFFLALLEKGHLCKKDSMQYYCGSCARFLPDRYVEGICPVCGMENVRGDQCDSCGETFEAGDLISPRCVHCDGVPEVKPTEHYFLKLSEFNDPLLSYLDTNRWWRSNVQTFTTNWLKDGLHDRAITRDMEWGVPVPVEGWGGKVIYVWFDAVLGYLSASKEHSSITGDPDLWKRYWQDPDVKHYYFLGKDNIPFHSIIWPAMLMGYGGLNLPYDIPANEYLMFRGGKLSKSRGGAIDIPSVLSVYDSDIVRYYLSAIMPDTHDSEFSWEDFAVKINNELVADLGNYYHRCLSFTHKNFGSIPEAGDTSDVDSEIEKAFGEYSGYLGRCDFKKALKSLMDLAHFGNRYFDQSKPWALMKTDKKKCGEVLNSNLKLVKALAVMSWPFMPKSSERIWNYLEPGVSLESSGYGSVLKPLKEGTVLESPAPVYAKVELPKPEKEKDPDVHRDEPQDFAKFGKLDIRVAEVMSAENHPDADKLFVLNVDAGEPRQIVAGLRAYYTKEQMVGRKVLMVFNLKPAKLRGFKSEGMLLAADDEDLGGGKVLLLTPSSDLPNGTRMDSGLGSKGSRIEYKEFTEAVMKVHSRRSASSIGANLPEGSPDPVVLIVDGDKVLPLSDGKGSIATLESAITDGASVR